MVDVALIKSFLDEIPSVIANAEPGNPYLAIPGAPDHVWKTISDFAYSPVEGASEFECSGNLIIQFVDAREWPGWNEFVEAHRDELEPGESNEKLYYKFIAETPGLKTPFVLEEFVDAFEDFYLDFLNENGIAEEDIEIEGNLLKYEGDPIEEE